MRVLKQRIRKVPQRKRIQNLKENDKMKKTPSETRNEENTRARSKALVLLNSKMRSESDLREKLSQNGFSPEEVDDALDYVKSFGYVDDARYAREYIETVGKRRSRNRVYTDLLRRGISKEVIEEIFAETEDDDETELIRKTAAKKMKTLDMSEYSNRRKVIAFLCGKGFQLNEIIRVVDELIEEQ